VQGTAILHAYAGGICIECGAYLSSAACPARRTGFATANSSVDHTYDQLLRSSHVVDDYIARRVFLKGVVIPDGATGQPMIQAAELRAAD